MIFFLKRAFYFVIDHWHIFAIGFAVLITVIFVYHACHKAPHLNEREIQQAQQAVKDRNDKVLKDILVNADVRESQIDANVSNAAKATDQVIRESQDKYRDLDTEQLAAEIERRKGE